MELLANIVRLHRCEEVETTDGSGRIFEEHFPDGAYVDVPGLCKVATRAEIEAQGWSLNPGLCKVATRAEIEAQGWSLNPGRYTGTATAQDDNEDFIERLENLYEEFTRLSDEAGQLRAKVDTAITGILST